MASGAAAAITLGRQQNIFGGAFASGIGLFVAVLISATISGNIYIHIYYAEVIKYFFCLF